jgi:nickel/cobalt transporter (NiCoT) family protein
MHGIGGIQGFADTWGTLFPAVFLLLIGAVNLLTLRRLWRARGGDTFDLPSAAGAMGRILRPVQRLIARPWHMVPVGFLFGLGFDTASEVALLVLTVQQSAAGLSVPDVLVVPALFTAGMVLVDTADSAVMTEAYDWALREPRRKLTYNIVVTAISVGVALAVGGVELVGLVMEHAPAMTGLAPVVGRAPEAMAFAASYPGLVVVAILPLLWGIAAIVARLRPDVAK